jgi:hypothetical protein
VAVPGAPKGSASGERSATIPPPAADLRAVDHLWHASEHKQHSFQPAPPARIS